MNSGFTATRTAGGAADSSDITCWSTRAVVPGNTVLRRTTVSGACVRRTLCRWRRRHRQGRQVLLSVSEVRCSNTDQRDLACARASSADSVAERRPSRTTASEQLVETRLDDRRQARVDHGDLVGTDIDAKDAMTVAREAGRRDASHIAETEYADFHDDSRDAASTAPT